MGKNVNKQVLDPCFPSCFDDMEKKNEISHKKHAT